MATRAKRVAELNDGVTAGVETTPAGVPTTEVLEASTAKIASGDYPYALSLESSRKVYGNGISVTVHFSTTTDATSASLDAAFSRGLDHFERVLRTHADRLNKLLQANSTEKDPIPTWDPTGDSAPAPLAKPPIGSAAPPPLTMPRNGGFTGPPAASTAPTATPDPAADVKAPMPEKIPVARRRPPAAAPPPAAEPAPAQSAPPAADAPPPAKRRPPALVAPA